MIKPYLHKLAFTETTYKYMVCLVLSNLLLIVHNAKPKQKEGFVGKLFCAKKDQNVSVCNLIFVLANEDVTSGLRQLKIQMRSVADNLKHMA